MTITEVINRLRYKAENIKAKLEPEYFSGCADYLERYRWHDLRKRHAVLPPLDEDVLVCARWDGDDEPFYTVACLSKSLGYWLYPDGRLVEVIAWRPVVPFEGGQDEEQ